MQVEKYQCIKNMWKSIRYGLKSIDLYMYYSRVGQKAIFYKGFLEIEILWVFEAYFVRLEKCQY